MKNQNLLLINYSEKSIAIFGDTKQFKEQFKELNGRFNPFLNLNGLKASGWVFSKAKEDKLKEILNGLIETGNPIETKKSIEPKKQVEVKKAAKKEVVKNSSNWSAYLKLKPNKKLAITNYLFFNVENNTIIQTNLINFIIVPFPADLQINKSCLISFNELKNIKELKTIEVNNNIATVNKVINLSTLDIKEFPKLPKTEIIETIENIDYKLIKNGLHAVGNDDMRLAMTGVFFGNKNEIATTNGHILYMTNFVGTLEKDYILNKELCSLINSNCQIEFGSINSVVKFNDITIIGKNTDERFPNYINAVPTENSNKLILDKGSLINAIKQALPFANKTTNQIIFELQEFNCKIIARDKDLKTNFETSLNADINSDVLKFAFNGKFLLNIINNLNSPFVQFKFSTEKRGFLIIDNNSTTLLMPVLIN